MRRSSLTLIVLLSCLSLSIPIISCSKEEKKEKAQQAKEIVEKEDPSRGTVVARVDGTPIYEEDLEGRSIEDAITEFLLYQEGLRRGIDKSAQMQVEDYKKRLVVRKLDERLLEEVEVEDSEIEAYYNEHKDIYARVKVLAIILGDKDQADEAYKKALSGEDFKRLADEYSVNLRELLVEPMDTLKGKEPGSIVLIPLRKEHRLLKVLERDTVPLDEAKGSITDMLKQIEQTKMRKEIIKRLGGNEVGKSLDGALKQFDLLYEEALQRGMGKDEEIERKVELYKRELVVERLLTRDIPKDISRQIGEVEIQGYYNKHKDEYSLVLAEQIVLNDRDLAQEVRKRALEGEDFNKLLQEYSISPPSLKRGRGVGFSSENRDIFKGKDLGAVSDVIEENGKYKILKLQQRHGRPFEKMKMVIERKLVTERVRDEIKGLIESLKKGKKIEIVGKRN